MKVILMVFLMLGSISISVLAQLNITAFPLASRSFDARTISLAHATVSLSGDYSDAKINPAGIGTEGILNLSADADFFYNPFRAEHEHYSLEGDYRFGKSAVSFSAQLLNTGEQVTTKDVYDSYQYKFNNKEVFLKAGYSYSVNEKFSLGMALNYLHSGEASGTSVSAQWVEPVHALSVDLGLQYQFSREIESGILEPSFGLALTNFGKGGDYFGRDRTYSMPTKLQAGAGLTFISSEKRNDRNMLEIRVLQNASKIMARMERKTSGSDTSFVAMNPFKALVKSWNSSEYFYGRYSSVSAKKQIWWHSGIEMKFLETFSLRWGLEQGGGFEDDLSYQSLGLGIDVFYVVLDYAFVFDNPDYRNFMEGHWWQLTGRIPLDGYRPKTILTEIF